MILVFRETIVSRVAPTLLQFFCSGQTWNLRVNELATMHPEMKRSHSFWYSLYRSARAANRHVDRKANNQKFTVGGRLSRALRVSLSMRHVWYTYTEAHGRRKAVWRTRVMSDADIYTRHGHCLYCCLPLPCNRWHVRAPFFVSATLLLQLHITAKWFHEIFTRISTFVKATIGGNPIR